MKVIKILDTTLRDGSYAVDFQFTAQDTADIAVELDKNNIHYIEVGHGLGLFASTDPKVKAPSTDEEYLEATANAVKNAKWGMFFIPGIGRIEDIDLAARYGMNFIRIGTNVTETDVAERYIQRAKEHGMYVFTNFMKTYAVSPKEVGKYAARANSFGADLVCVVDSAGGMLPEDVESYFCAIQDKTDIAIGFHGHNNLGLAIANTLKAIEKGAEVVDTSIRGIGRSAGNAATEILIFALKRKGIDLGIDPMKIMDIAEQVVDPILKSQNQIDSLSIVSGYAQFHSTFLGRVLEYAEKYCVDPRELIIYVCEEDRVNAQEALVEAIARDLANNKKSSPVRIMLSSLRTTGLQPLGLDSQALSVAKEVRTIAKKYGRVPVFNLVQSFRKQGLNFVSSVIHDGSQYSVASAEVSAPLEAAVITQAVDELVEIILLDCDIKLPNSDKIIQAVRDNAKNAIVLMYSDIQAWGKSISLLVQEKLADRLQDSKILVVGNNLLAKNCASCLNLLATKVYEISQSNIKDYKGCDVIICCEPIQDLSLITALANKGFMVDAMVGSLSQDIINSIHSQDIPTYRPDMRIAIHSEIASVAGMRDFVSRVQGRRLLNGIEIAAGGVLAPKNSVIVDSISQPARIFGIADGNGFLLSQTGITEELQSKMRIVQESLKRM